MACSHKSPTNLSVVFSGQYMYICVCYTIYNYMCVCKCLGHTYDNSFFYPVVFLRLLGEVILVFCPRIVGMCICCYSSALCSAIEDFCSVCWLGWFLLVFPCTLRMYEYCSVLVSHGARACHRGGGVVSLFLTVGAAAAARNIT